MEAKLAGRAMQRAKVMANTNQKLAKGMVRAPKAAGAMVTKAAGAMVQKAAGARAQKAAGAMVPKAGAMMVRAGDMLPVVMVAKVDQRTILLVHPDLKKHGLTRLSSRTTSSSSSPRRGAGQGAGWGGEEMGVKRSQTESNGVKPCLATATPTPTATAATTAAATIAAAAASGE